MRWDASSCCNAAPLSLRAPVDAQHVCQLQFQSTLPLTRSFLFPTACRYYRTDGAAFKKMGAVKAATLQMMLETGYDVFIRCARYLSERRMQAETKHVAPLL